MGEEEGWGSPPTSAPFNLEKDHMRNFDNSINAVSFGFLATAILISMFLIMAIFERFIRPNSPDSAQAGGGRRRRHSQDLESQTGFAGKLCHTSPKLSTVQAREISVMMPGENLPTFIAYPAPVPCPPKRISWPPPLFPNHASSPIRNQLGANSNAAASSSSSSSSSMTRHQPSENEIVCLPS